MLGRVHVAEEIIDDLPIDDIAGRRVELGLAIAAFGAINDLNQGQQGELEAFGARTDHGAAACMCTQIHEWISPRSVW